MSELQHTLPTPVGGRTRSLRTVAVCLLTGLVLAILPFVEHAALYGIVLAMLLCVAVPIWLAWHRHELDYFEPIHIFGLTYFIFFGMGAIWTVNDPAYVAYDLYIVPYIPKAAFYCLLGYLALLAGYYGPWRGRIKVRPEPEFVQGPTFVALAAVLGIVGYLAVGLLERSMLMNSPVTPVIGSLSQLAPVFLFAWALGWLLFYSGRSTRGQKLVLVALLIPGAFLTAKATLSDKSLLMVLIGVPIVARWYTKRKIPWVFLLVLLLVLMFVIFPFYNTYRWSDPTMNQSDRLQITYDTVQTWDADTYMLFSLRTFTRRLAMINSVAVVARDVPRWVPYAQGQTLFMPALTQFIPRVLWPDKPIATLGRDFGRIFRVTNMFTKNTYIGVTVPGDLYWNFDLPGIIVGMALLGGAMRFAYRRYGEGSGLDPLRRSIHILLLVQIAHLAGASIAGTAVMVIRTVVVLEVMRWIGQRTGMVIPDTAGAGGRAAAGS